MRRVSAIVLLSILLGGCGPASPPLGDATATQYVTLVTTVEPQQVEAEPTSTVAPTITPAPTQTVIPSPTNQASAAFPEVSLPFTTDGGALPENALLRIGVGFILTHAVSPD